MYLCQIVETYPKFGQLIRIRCYFQQFLYDPSQQLSQLQFFAQKKTMKKQVISKNQQILQSENNSKSPQKPFRFILGTPKAVKQLLERRKIVQKYKNTMQGSNQAQVQKSNSEDKAPKYHYFEDKINNHQNNQQLNITFGPKYFSKQIPKRKLSKEEISNRKLLQSKFNRCKQILKQIEQIRLKNRKIKQDIIAKSEIRELKRQISRKK